MLYSCGISHHQVGDSGLSNHKLIAAQVLIKCQDHREICANNIPDSGTSNPGKLNVSVQADSKKTNKVSLAFLPKIKPFHPPQWAVHWQKPLQNFNLSQNPVAHIHSAGDTTENPFLAPLISFLGAELIDVIIGYSDVAISASILGIFGAILVGVFGGIAIIVFLIFIALNRDDRPLNREKSISYSIAWIFSLICLLLSLIMLSSGTASPAILTVIFFVMLIVFLVQWANNLHNKWESEPGATPEEKKKNLDARLYKTPAEKRQDIINTLLCFAWLLGIVFSLVVSDNGGILLAAGLIFFAGFYILWLLRQKPMDRETIYFISALLLLIIGLATLPPINIGLAFVFYFTAAAIFLFLWIKHLSDWEKPKKTEKPNEQ